MFEKRMLGVVGALSVMVGGAYADTIFADYEAPQYGVGTTLTGQNNWVSLAPGLSAGVIQNTNVHSGKQAVTVTRPAGAPGSTGAVWKHTGLLASEADPIVKIEWFMLALDGSQKSDVWGVSSMMGETERFTVGINGTNKLMVRNGMIGTVTTNIGIARNTWNKYRMELNYVTNKGSVFFNDAFVGEWKTNGGGLEHTATALFNRFGGNDGAIYDGLSVTAGAAPVPEPATIVGAALGLVALARRKRQK